MKKFREFRKRAGTKANSLASSSFKFIKEKVNRKLPPTLENVRKVWSSISERLSLLGTKIVHTKIAFQKLFCFQEFTRKDANLLKRDLDNLGKLILGCENEEEPGQLSDVWELVFAENYLYNLASAVNLGTVTDKNFSCN